MLQEVALLNRTSLHEHGEEAVQLRIVELGLRQAATGFNPRAGLTSVGK